MKPKLRIGVLAIQGAYQKHLSMITALGEEGRLIRCWEELDDCDGLILPGGESTAMSHQLSDAWVEVITGFAAVKPVFGTCAGLILLSTELVNGATVKTREAVEISETSKTSEKPKVRCLGLIDMVVERNGFGRQNDSFETEDIIIAPNLGLAQFSAVFIRAPRIRNFGANVKILATWREEPVLVEQGNCLAATFHPELTDNLAVHQYFIQKIVKYSNFFDINLES